MDDGGLTVQDLRGDLRLGDIEVLGVFFPDGRASTAYPFPLRGWRHLFRAVGQSGEVCFFRLAHDGGGGLFSEDVTAEVTAVVTERLQDSQRRDLLARNEAEQRARGAGDGLELVKREDVVVALFGNDTGTAERAGQGQVERVDTLEDNKRARASRAVDTLARLAKSGTITRGQLRAGRRFKAAFDTGGLCGLRAMPLVRMPGGTGGRGDATPVRVMDARAIIRHAMDALGGERSPCADCMWYVVGLELSIKEWAGAQGFALREKAAVGVLIGALGVLECHWYGAADCDS